MEVLHSQTVQKDQNEICDELVQSSVDSLHGFCTNIAKILDDSDAVNFEEAAFQVGELLSSITNVILGLPISECPILDLNSATVVPELICTAITSQEFIRSIMNCQQCIQSAESIRLSLLHIAYISMHSNRSKRSPI